MPIDDDHELLGPVLEALQERFPRHKNVAYDPKQEWDTRSCETGTVTGWSVSGVGVYVQFDDGGGAKYVDPAFLMPLDSNGNGPDLPPLPDYDAPAEDDAEVQALADEVLGDEPEPAVHLGPNRHITEPIDAAEAHRIADQAEHDPDTAVVLMPTIDSVLSNEQDPAQALNAIRALLSSLHGALHKGLASDLEADPPPLYGSHLGSTARVMEDALMQVYGEEPLVLARVLMQSQIDHLLDEMQDEIAALETEETEESREPAAPVEAESTRAPNEHEVRDTLSTIENVVWDMAIETMPGGAVRYTLSNIADAQMQSWLQAVAVDAAEQSIQEAGVGNGVDRLRAVRGILSLALAHVGEAIQSLEPDATQVGTSTAANGIEHTIRLGDAAPSRDRSYIPADEITPSGKRPGYYEGSVAHAIGGDVCAAIASLETGAVVAGDVDFSVVQGVHPAPGEHVQITLPVRLDITGAAR